ncbi:hypothetical protein ACJJTC_008204 [Scirpophaga incertulas]
MTSKSEKDRAKQIQDRCQNILMQMLKDEDNKYCVDCDAKGPRWASWNLGIFLCIRCAGIHRNLGVHISKVKSVNLDSWTPEQVVSLQQMGNSRARAVYEANLPDSFRRPQNDSPLESFIRAKYEQKKYIAKEWVQPPTPKVNWDKEIDEEMEKQKRKKKTTSSSGLGPLPTPTSSDKKYNKSDIIPSIPKPKSSVSPKLCRNTPTNQTETKPSNGSADLLGLDNCTVEMPPPSDDIFSSFFSAPQEKSTEPKPELDKSDLKVEEENFFKQAAPTEKEKSKLTKDSILALYSQSPSNLGNQFNPIPPVQPGFAFGAPSTAFQAPHFNMPVQNSMPSNLQSNIQFSQFQPQTNQFNQPISSQYQQPFGQPMQQTNQPFQQNNQFFNQPQQNLSQQFGGLNLGQSFPNAFAQNTNVASNSTWQ